jgi:hypothetical protein
VIAEALAWLTTPAPWAARRLGYLYEAVAITARYRRCRAAWAAHLAASRETLLAFSAALPRRRTLVVLGSGAGYDLPLETLARQWQQILLVDLVHPWPIRWRTLAYRHVYRAVWDVAGVVAALIDHPATPPEPRPHWPLPPTTDAVVSLNLMAQLPIVPLATRAAQAFSDEERAAWAQAIVATHWHRLAALSCPSLVITDIASVTLPCDNENSLISERGTLAGFVPPQPSLATWWWEIAPCGEESPSARRRLQVAVYRPS